MKILFSASEMEPLARTGGLGDVIEAQPAALMEEGHEVSVVLPCYRGLREDPKLAPRSTGVEVHVQIGPKRVSAEILEATAPNGVQVFLVRRDEYFDRSGFYGADGHDYGDNAERFIFFSRAVVELARRILPAPDIIHAHDWQTALVPVFVKEKKLPFKTVLTIHNLAYQGSFWGFDFGLTSLPGEYFSAKGVEFYGRLNLLKGGLLFADAVTTVSERYALEIQTPEHGCGLDMVMREQAHKLSGILNGADYRIWNPAGDAHLAQTFQPGEMQGKSACRAELLAELGLAPDPRGPVIGVVSRMAEQKGFDLLLPLLDRLLADDVRLVMLGEGGAQFERDLLIASKRHAERFIFVQASDDRLAHLIYAASDLFLIPSHFEPCGLTAMYALKYGAVPIAHATGGLYQSIQDYDPTNESGNGFLYFEDTAEALWDAITRAKACFRDVAHWSGLVRRAMRSDFSWKRAVERYEAVYARVLRGK